MRRLLGLSLFTLVVALQSAQSPRSARADAAEVPAELPPEPGEPPGYRPIIDHAIEEFRRANFAEAREQFARAHALFPSARTLRGLGMSEFELRNYVDAVTRLEEALASKQRPLTGTLREQTVALLQRAKGYVGEIVLHVTPSSTRVHVDGFPTEPSANGRLRLEVGDHVLEFSAQGYLNERRALKIRGEQVLELQISLSQPSAPLTAGAMPAAERKDETPLYKRWWLWTGVGAVVVAGVVAGVLVATRKTQEQDPYKGTAMDTIVVK